MSYSKCGERVLSDLKVIGKLELMLTFDNGAIRIFNFAKEVKEYPVFKPLTDEKLFERARISPGGYAVVWNDEIDYASCSLYDEGLPYA